MFRDYDPLEGGLMPLVLGQHHMTREQPIFQLSTVVQREVCAERLLVSCSVGRCDLLSLDVLGTNLFAGHIVPAEAFELQAFGTRLTLEPWKPGVQVVLHVRWNPPPRIAYLEPTRWNLKKYRRAWYVSFSVPRFSAMALCRVPV